MKKKRLKTVCFGLLLGMAMAIYPCTTFYSDGGDSVQFCVTNAAQENADEVCPFCNQTNCDNDWTQLFDDEENVHEEL